MGLSLIKNPKNVKFYGEDDDEYIILLLRKHPITNFGPIIVGMLLFFLPFLLGFGLSSVNFSLSSILAPKIIFMVLCFWYLFFVGFIFMRALNWYFNVYIVTNKKIVDVDFHRLLHRNISQASLRNIEDITNTMSGMFSILFNYGDVIIQTAGETREFDFLFVPNPSLVQDIIADMVANLHQPSNSLKGPIT